MTGARPRVPPLDGPMRDDESIVILTGAGISKESGLATFRDKDGIWARTRLEDVATPEAFARDPALVQIARAGGARTLELNLEPGMTASAFDDHRFGPATQVVPAWVAGILAGAVG